MSNFFHLPPKNKREQPGSDQWGLGPQLLPRSAAREIGFKYESVVLEGPLLLQIGHTTLLKLSFLILPWQDFVLGIRDGFFGMYSLTHLGRFDHY